MFLPQNRFKKVSLRNPKISEALELLARFELATSSLPRIERLTPLRGALYQLDESAPNASKIIESVIDLFEAVSQSAIQGTARPHPFLCSHLITSSVHETRSFD